VLSREGQAQDEARNSSRGATGNEPLPSLSAADAGPPTEGRKIQGETTPRLLAGLNTKGAATAGQNKGPTHILPEPLGGFRLAAELCCVPAISGVSIPAHNAFVGPATGLLVDLRRDRSAERLTSGHSALISLSGNEASRFSPKNKASGFSRARQTASSCQTQRGFVLS